MAVGLVRCSTDDQEHSIADQRIEIETWARESGHDLLEVFEDEGVSGCELDRPGVRQLLSYLEASEVKGTLVVWKRNRLARPDDPRDGLLLERRIERAGWGIRYLHGTQASGNKLVDTLMGVIEHHQSGEYLRSLASDTLRGQLRRALEGNLLVGLTPYAYARRVTDASGNVRVLGRTLPYRRSPGDQVCWTAGDPEEIAVVRRLFEQYGQEEFTPIQLCGQLNEEGVPSPTGRNWNDQTIRRILGNPVYVGDFVWNKRTNARFFKLVRGKVTRRNQEETRTAWCDEQDQVVLPDHHEPLVSRELFDQVQAVLKKRSHMKGAGRQTRTRQPLSGILFCAQCGSKMTAKKEHWAELYACSGYSRRKICKCYLIRADVIEPAVLRTLKEAYAPYLEQLGPDLREEVLNQLRPKGQDLRSTSLERLRRRQVALDRKIEQAVENMGVVGPDMAAKIAQRAEDWGRERARLAGEIEAAEAAQVKPADQEEAVDQILGLFQELEDTKKDAPRAALRRLFLRAVERIELRYEVDPAKAHWKTRRNRCAGGILSVTPLLDEGDNLLSATPLGGGGFVVPAGWQVVLRTNG